MSGQKDPKDPIEDLRKLLVTPVALTVGGRSLQLRPFRFADLPRVVELVRQAQGCLRLDGGGVDVDLVTLLLQQHGTALELMQLLSGEPREWVEGLPADEAFALLGACIRVNADFFIQRLAPMLMLASSSLAMFASPSASQSDTPPAGATSSLN